jgi:hypothetical protein
MSRVWTPLVSTVNGLGVVPGPSSSPGPGWEVVLRCGLSLQLPSDHYKPHSYDEEFLHATHFYMFPFLNSARDILVYGKIKYRMLPVVR